MATYTNLEEKNARLVEDLIRESQSQSQSQSHPSFDCDLIQAILDWENGEMRVVDVNPDIRILSAREFADALRLQDSRRSHSWAGDKETKEYGFLVAGNAEFGVSRHHSYYDNGKYAGGDEKIEDGDFDLDQVQIALINQRICDHFNGSCRDEDYWCLYIYLPMDGHTTIEG